MVGSSLPFRKPAANESAGATQQERHLWRALWGKGRLIFLLTGSAVLSGVQLKERARSALLMVTVISQLTRVWQSPLTSASAPKPGQRKRRQLSGWALLYHTGRRRRRGTGRPNRALQSPEVHPKSSIMSPGHEKVDKHDRKLLV